MRQRPGDGSLLQCVVVSIKRRKGEDRITTVEAADTIAGSPELDPTLAALPQADAPRTSYQRASSSEGFAHGAVIDRYVLLDKLGAGGMGVVYRAYDPELDRRIALKFLRPDQNFGPTLRARLLREAQALAKLSHPTLSRSTMLAPADPGNGRDAGQSMRKRTKQQSLSPPIP